MKLKKTLAIFARKPGVNSSVASRALSLRKKTCWMGASCLVASLLVSSTLGFDEAHRSDSLGFDSPHPTPTSGDLIWYRHDGWHNGSNVWANRGAGANVGNGFQDFQFVFATSNGVIYGVRPNGDLMWYQHNRRQQGLADFAHRGAGVRVGYGWQGFKSVFASSHGVIYGIQPNGDLLWYRHEGFHNGTVKWTNGGKGIKVGRGWQFFKFVFAMQPSVPQLPSPFRTVGVIYGVRPEGDLLWYKHEGWLNGDNEWADDSGKNVGVNWSNFTAVFAAPNGIIYAVEPDGDLLWYNHTGVQYGARLWARGGINGVKVGNGWGFKFVFASCLGTFPPGLNWDFGPECSIYGVQP